jgi:hypothetical protein
MCGWVFNPAIDFDSSQSSAVGTDQITTEGAFSIGVEDYPIPVGRPIRAPVVERVIGQIAGLLPRIAHDKYLVIFVDPAAGVAVYDETPIGGPSTVEMSWHPGDRPERRAVDVHS